MNTGLLARGLAFGAALLASAPAMAGGIVYVDDDAPPAGDGTSWETAFRFLRDGLDLAAKGGITEIRVGQGVQLPDRNEKNPGGTQFRQDSFMLVGGVAVRGAYAGIGAADPDVRDVTKFETILLGDLLGDDEGEFGNNGDNSFQIVLTGGEGTPILDGFTVRGANGSGLRIQSATEVVACTFDRNFGAGVVQIDIAEGASLAECTFSGNAGNMGGGLSAGAPMTLSDCTFRENTATEAGAIFATAAIRLTRCNFLENESTSRSAGAIELRGEGAVVEDCVFERNRSAKSAGAAEARFGTFTDCVFRDNTTVSQDGGAMLVSGPVTLTRCTFEANVAPGDGGAVIVVEPTDPVLVLDCVFTANAANRGGGLFSRRTRDVVITACTFTENHATTGGGLYVYDRSTVVVTKCTFDGNRALDGAGIVNDDESHSEIIDCVLIGNVAARNGGGIANLFQSRPVIRDCRFESNEAQEGAGVFNLTGSDALVTGCTFEANRAVKGAGIANGDSRPVILESTFLANVATGWGGGIANTDAEVIIGRCSFLGNRATALGGGLYSVTGSNVTVTNSLFSGNTAIEGGAVRSFNSVGSLINCTLAANEAVFGAALSSRGTSDTSVENCVLWANGDDGIDATSIAVRYSDVEGGHAGVGNIDADPGFIDPLGADGIAGTPDDDLRLLAGSPAIDAGDGDALPGEINLDLDGAPRFVDDPDTPDTGAGHPAFIDLGAYEFQIGCTGDVDGNGDVGFSDVLAILAAWGPCAECGEDIDGDGEVGFAEVLIVLGAWGACP